MKTIKLFFDFEFTSLSPDAQPISLGILSEETFDKKYRALYSVNAIISKGNCSIDHLLPSKSFYAEFSDFDLSRCDDWVKENVVSKLILNRDNFTPKNIGKFEAHWIDLVKGGKYLLFQKEWEKGDHPTLVQFDTSPMVYGDTIGVAQSLRNWLSQFSGYNIQFVCDCGTWDWYWMLQLIGEWEDIQIIKKINGANGYFHVRAGLPKLPSNISPVPEDLNDLIAHKKGISVREAFDLDRDELFYALCDRNRTMPLPEITKNIISTMVPDKHNSLSDAKVIKAIYEKLK